MRACSLRLLAPLLLLLALALPVAAQPNFSQMVTFGDSLTHNDLLGLISGQPQDLYGDDPHEAAFYKAAAVGDDLDSYAVGGSESQHIEVQIELYDFLRLIGSQDRATFIGFEIGGNDILNNIGDLAAGPPGSNPAGDAVINAYLQNVRNDLLHLSRTHPGARAIVWTIPDVTQTPDQWNIWSETQEGYIRAHIERANDRLRVLNTLANVLVFDLYAELNEIIASPPVIIDTQLVGPPAFGGEYHYLFADEIHPTAVSNALIANGIIEAMNDKWGTAYPLYSEFELADLARIEY